MAQRPVRPTLDSARSQLCAWELFCRWCHRVSTWIVGGAKGSSRSTNSSAKPVTLTKWRGSGKQVGVRDDFAGGEKLVDG